MIKINKTGALSVQHIYNYKYESKQSKRSYFFNIFFLGIICGAAFKELLVYAVYARLYKRNFLSKQKFFRSVERLNCMLFDDPKTALLNAL